MYLIQDTLKLLVVAVVLLKSVETHLQETQELLEMVEMVRLHVLQQVP
tara:strand:+ start:291 stop:434 length:144 start_codon:yes stop_codon:yes gene_type:complete